jgi:glutamate N-acetyltransferase/amino-acid N-acetyltransferase
MTPPSKKKLISVPGFKFSGVSAGIKKGGKRDLAVIYSEKEASVAGVFTTNSIKASPVQLDIKRIASKKGQAIIVNSGNANACTGSNGLRDAKEMCKITAGEIGISSDLVYVSSTGIIGRPMPMPNIKRGIPRAVKKLSPYSIHDAACAIMTTDTFPKLVCRKLKLGRKTGIIAGIAKGAGMICPDMATMLCFIFSDIAINPDALDQALKKSVNKSFNRLTIDNEMSTNDTVIAMANGVSGNSLISGRSSSYSKFRDLLNEVTYELSTMIALDGEGATKMINVVVNGAMSERDAERVARSIAGSPLVKTAIYGRDPNWGRIIAAAGYSGSKVVEKKIDISINACKVFSKGLGTGKESAARKALSKKEVIITVNLGIGRGSAHVMTCDLTEEYVKINSAYST